MIKEVYDELNKKHNCPECYYYDDCSSASETGDICGDFFIEKENEDGF